MSFIVARVAPPSGAQPQASEHPPVHAHVLHPDGKALVYLSGKTLNSGVPQWSTSVGRWSGPAGHRAR
jgi:hypothetical protein